MDILLRENLSKFQSRAIVLCDGEKILKSMTYEEVLTLSKKIIVELSDVVTANSQCIGLLMEHNIYLPTVLISLQNMHRPFTFVRLANLHDSVKNLGINFVLSFCNVDNSDFKEVHRVHFERNMYLALWEIQNPKKPKSMESIFTVVQTSGSTGKEKIIRVPYACIESNIFCLSKLFNISNQDIIFWGTPLSFDPNLVEFLLAMHSGATLVIVPYRIYLNPGALFKALFCVANITFLQMVPSVFTRWDKYYQENIFNNNNLRILAFGGEPFPKSILDFERNKSLRVFNLYGITEASCWATIHEITDENCTDDIPIGNTLDDTSVEVRDEEGKNLQNGQGEIFIGSSMRICYVDDESSESIHRPCFRATGDIANINEKGIIYITRKNQVIKRFGHRVNLYEIEQIILEESGFLNKCIWSQTLNKLLAFIKTPEDYNKIYADRILDKLRVKMMSLLPETSYPDHFEIVKKFPLTSHGKLDTRFLEELYLASISNKTYVESDQIFSELWCKYLGINMDALASIKQYSFVELGGNSISALQMTTEFNEIVKSEYLGDILGVVLEKKFQDCILYLKNLKRILKESAEIDKHVWKRIKLNDHIFWSYNMRACVDASPLVFEESGKVYIAIGSFSGIFVVLTEDGNEIYKHIFPNTIQATPILSQCGNFIFVGCFNGSMYCIDFLKNQISWEFSTASIITNSPCLCKDNQAIVFGSYDKFAYCLWLKDGHQLWKQEVDGSISANPIYDDNTGNIFISTTRGTCFCLNEDTGLVIFKYNFDEPIFGTPCLISAGSKIIIATVKNNLYCLSIKEATVDWSFSVGSHIYSALINVQDSILFGCHDKNVYLVNPSEKQCTLMNKLELDSAISSTCFVYQTSDNAFIAVSCNSGVIYIVDFSTFFVINIFRLPGEVFSSPIVKDNKLFVGCRDNNLYCIKLNKI